MNGKKKAPYRLCHREMNGVSFSCVGRVKK